MKQLLSNTILTLNHFWLNISHFFSAKHYAALWVLLVLAVTLLVVSIIKYRALWKRYWRRVALGAVVVIAVAAFWLVPKIKYYYDTRLLLPSHLTEAEKKQRLDEWQQVMNNKEHGKNNSLLYNDIGILRAGVKDYNGAVSAFKLAIKRNPDDTRFWRNLAITYTNMDRYDDAEKAFQQAFKIAPTQPEYWLELGELYTFKIKDNQKARTFYLEAISRSNTNINVAQAYANFLENIERNYAEAIKYWQIVADGAPEQSKLAFNAHIAELKTRYNIK